MSEEKKWSKRIWIKKAPYEGMQTYWNTLGDGDEEEYISFAEHAHLLNEARAEAFEEAAEIECENTTIASNGRAWSIFLEKAAKLRGGG